MNIETANRLAELRKKSGLSQEELADKLGLSRQAVSKWERAESSPDTDNLILLAKIYGVSLDELLKTDKPVDEIIKDNQDRTKEENTNKEEQSKEDQPKDEQQKRKDRVSISSDGIHVESEDGDSVHIGTHGIHINDSNYKYKFDDSSDKRHKVVGLLNGIFFALACLAYILIGVFCKGPSFASGSTNNGWAVGWIVFLLAPIIPSIVDAIWKRRLSKVNFFFMGLSAFLYLGMMYGLWHPWWCLIVASIVIHIVISSIEGAIFDDEKKFVIHGNHDEDEDEDEDDEDDDSKKDKVVITIDSSDKE